MGAFSNWRGRRSKLGPGNEGGPSFADVAGAPSAVEELQELCDLLRSPERYAALGARPPKGALLVGPPGTGKTLLARATAGEAHAAFFSVSGAEFVESLVGVGAARIRDLFAQARAAAPAIVFIDELDAVGRKRGAGVGQGNDEREQTLNQLLVEMDGFDAGRGLIVLAATNRPDILDPALLRPGRFDRQITVDAPDVEGRTEILELYLDGPPVRRRTSSRPTSPAAAPASPAPSSRTSSTRRRCSAPAPASTAIGVHDLDEAIQRVVGGPRTETHVLGDDELETIAVHEAAHAVVAAAHGDGDQMHQLSIVARGRRLGRATALLLDRDRTVLRRSDLERQLTVTMAGAAAERLAFGEVSTAVNEDLHTATQLARSMVTSFGMSSLGPVTIGEQSAEVFLGASLQELGSVGPGTLERIDAETRAIVEAGRGARRDDAERELGRGAGDRPRARRVRDARRRRAAGRPSGRRARRAAPRCRRRKRGAVRRRLAQPSRPASPRWRRARAGVRRRRPGAGRAGAPGPARAPRSRARRARSSRSGSRRRRTAPARGRSASPPGAPSCCSARRAAAGRHARCRWPGSRSAARAPQHAGELAADGRGAVLLADPEHPEADAQLLVRAPGATFAARPRADAVLAPGERLVAERDAPGRASAARGHRGREADAATLVAPTDRRRRRPPPCCASTPTGWHREAIAADGSRPVHPVALAAAGPTRAWLLGTAGDRVVLLHREPPADGEPRWVPTVRPATRCWPAKRSRRGDAGRAWTRRRPTRSRRRPTACGWTSA